MAFLVVHALNAGFGVECKCTGGGYRVLVRQVCVTVLKHVAFACTHATYFSSLYEVLGETSKIFPSNHKDFTKAHTTI